MTRWRSLVTVGIALVVMSPVLRPSTWDDFPISSYPMFSRGDIAGPQELAQALVVFADGHRTPATPSQVGSVEPMVAMTTIWQAVRLGKTSELCTLIASHVTDPNAVAVEVVVSAFDPKTYFQSNDRAPQSRTVHARCEAKRP